MCKYADPGKISQCRVDTVGRFPSQACVERVGDPLLRENLLIQMFGLGLEGWLGDGVLLHVDC